MAADPILTQTFRSSWGRGFSVLWAAFVIFNIWDIARRGFPHAGLVALSWLAFGTAIVYITGWRPRLTYDPAAVTVTNPLRTERIPWNAVTDIDATDALRVHTASRRVRSFAVVRGGAVSSMFRGMRGSAAARNSSPEGAAMAEIARRTLIEYASSTLRDQWLRNRSLAKGSAVTSWAIPEIVVLLATALLAVILSAT